MINLDYNDSRSKFYEIFNENILSYIYMESYLEILFTQEDDIAKMILKSVDEYFSKLPKGTTVGDIRYDNVPSLVSRLFLRNFDELSFKKLQNFNNRNFVQFFYTEFEFYFFKCLKYVYSQRPDILENKQIKIKLLLEHKMNIDTILQAKIERVIEQHLHENFHDLFKYINKPLGLEHNLTEKEINQVIEFKLLRDLYAHGDGTVTQIFLDKVNNTNLKLGEKMIITKDIITKYYLIVINTLNKFDNAFIQKYPETIQEIE